MKKDDNDLCNGRFRKDIFYYRFATKYVRFDEEDQMWEECNVVGVCDETSKTIPMDMFPTNHQMICIDFICLQYDETTGDVHVSDHSVELIKSKFQVEMDNQYSLIRESRDSYDPVNCKNEEFVFRDGDNFFSKNFEMSFERLDKETPVGSVEVRYFSNEQYVQEKDNNNIVDDYILPPKPFYCTMNWHDAQYEKMIKNPGKFQDSTSLFILIFFTYNMYKNYSEGRLISRSGSAN